jgi:hypothetical protein
MRMAEVAAVCFIVLGLFISAVHPLRGHWEGVITSRNMELRVVVHQAAGHQLNVQLTGTLEGHSFGFAWSSDGSQRSLQVGLR